MRMEMATPPEPMMTAEEVAAFLKISLSMVYKLRREGRLPGVPVGALWRWNPTSCGEVPPPSGAPVVPLAGRRRRV